MAEGEGYQSLRSERLLAKRTFGESSTSSAAPPSVSSLSRVVIDDQVTRSLADYVRCGICFTVLTAEKRPVECSECRNTLSCTTCIREWLGSHPSCPYCKHQHPVFEDVSPALASLLSSLRFTCRFKRRGCTEQPLVGRELAKHEALCIYQDGNNEEGKEGSSSNGGSSGNSLMKACKLCSRKH